jgi:putative transposase
MARKPRKAVTLPTLWEIPDELWKLIEPILVADCPPKEGAGRSRINWRRALDGIIYRMRTGCQWNQLPKDFGDDSSIHRWFQRWNRRGVMKQIMALLISDCAELGGVNWEWQSADGAMAKARFGGTKSGQIPRIGRKWAPSVV